MKKSILIFGFNNDLHIKTVQSCMEAMGRKAYIFDRSSKGNQITIDPENKFNVFNIDGEILNFNEISSVWWRLKPDPYLGSDISEKGTRDFIDTEWRFTLNSIQFYLKNVKWINNPKYQHEINYKPYQLLLAKECGFTIPDTKITNNPKEVLKMFEKTENTVYKQVGWTMFPNGEVIYTNKINREMITNNYEGLEICPGIFQEYVEKEYELRITVIGDVIFSVKINSQLSEQTKIDWRKDQFQNMYEVYDLPEKLINNIREFQRKSGLVYGAYDLIKSKSGGYVFLECNPSGQWLWMENKLGIPISETFAHYLMNE